MKPKTKDEFAELGNAALKASSEMNRKSEIYRILALRMALRLEIKGMKHSSGYSAYSRIKKEFNLTGNKVRVLLQLNDIIQERILK